MSPRPLVGSFAEAVYAAIEPAAEAGQDEDNGWPLLGYLGALCDALFQPIEDLVRDSDLGPGWTVVADPDRAPAEWLPWLAQFAGVRLTSSLEAERRAAIKRRDATKRGSIPALRDAIRATLTGDNPTIVIRERPAGAAYALRIRTLEAETPDEDAVLAAIRSQKAGGLFPLDYETSPGWTFDLLASEYSDFADVAASFHDFAAVTVNDPD